MLRRDNAVEPRKQEACRNKPTAGDERNRLDQLVGLFFQTVFSKYPADSLNRQQVFTRSIEKSVAHSQMRDIRAAIWSDTAQLFYSFSRRDLDVGGSV